MGQTIFCYDCCWCADCYCVGCSYSLFCFNCWMCQPTYLTMVRPNQCCLTGGCNHGYGATYLCYGGYCCAPDYLVSYSIRDHIGVKMPYLGDLQLSNAANQGGTSGQVMMMNGGGYGGGGQY